MLISRKLTKNLEGEISTYYEKNSDSSNSFDIHASNERMR